MTDETCGCGGGLVPPCLRRQRSDLQILRDLAPDTLELLDTDPAGVLDLLQLVPGVTAVTGGHGAVLSAHGRYGAVQQLGGSVVVGHGTIGVRRLPGRPCQIYRVAPLAHASHDATASSAPASVQLFDSDGRGLHRVFVPQPQDLRVLDSAWPTSTSFGTPFGEGDDGAAAPFATLTAAASTPGPVLDQIDLADAHLTDTPGERLATLRTGCEHAAREISTWLLPEMCSALAQQHLPVTLAVTAPGVQQSTTGVIGSVSRPGATLRLGLSHAAFALSLSSVTRMWVSRVEGPHGPTSALELFDIDDRALALLTVTGAVPASVHHRWEELCALV